MLAWPSYPLEFWLLAGLAVILIGISKAGFGGGIGVAATPLIALVLPVTEAVALLLPLLLVADLFAARHYLRTFDRANLRLLLPSAVVGIVLGSLFFDLFSDQERVLKVGIGVIALLFVLFQTVRALLVKAFERRPPNRPLGIIFGAVAGFTSTVAHVGGPPIAMYLLPQRLPRRVFVGTNVWFFLLVNALKLVPYGILGLLAATNLMVIVILLPLIYLGIRLGLAMIRAVNERLFNLVIYLLLTLTAVQLLLGRSLIGLLASG